MNLTPASTTKALNMTNKIILKFNRLGFLGFLNYMKATVYYFLQNDLLKKKYMTRRIHDYKLSLDLADKGISRQLVKSGTREEQLRYILKNEIKPGMTILDIGANIGYYPIMEAKLAGTTGFIYAVEPSPDNFQQLLNNIKLNNLDAQFKTYNIGISSSVGQERFFLSTHSNLHTFIRDGFNGSYTTKGVSDDYLEVEVTDLSTFLKDKKNVDLIRMDVEGYEVEILEGLETAISTSLFNGKIVFECHFPKYDNDKHSIRKQIEMLFRNSYKIKYMTSNDDKKSRIRELGYKPVKTIRTGDVTTQSVYVNISDRDAITLISELGGVRDVLFQKVK
ncbi:MAG: FkbM family methyltransferase [Bacteroidetes bacterium]|nr:FkbM family methyltransferase [Bacteroidota bacterium]